MHDDLVRSSEKSFDLGGEFAAALSVFRDSRDKAFILVNIGTQVLTMNSKLLGESFGRHSMNVITDQTSKSLSVGEISSIYDYSNQAVRLATQSPAFTLSSVAYPGTELTA